MSGFADDKEQLAQLDINTGHRATVSIDNATVVNNFYSIRLGDGTRSDVWEKRFSEVESAAAPAIRRAIEHPHWQPSPQERMDIATWIGLQFLRGTSHRRSLANVKAIAYRMQVGMGGIEYLRHAMQLGLGRDVEDSELSVVWEDLTRPGGPRVAVTGDEHIESLTRTVEDATKIVFSRGWHIVRFDRLQLAMNDTPVALIADEEHPAFLGVGLINAGSITVALNRYTLLWLGAIGEPDFEMPASVVLARAHNHSVLFNADRFVYFHPDDNPLPNLPMPRPPREDPDPLGPDMINRDRPLPEVLKQIADHEDPTGRSLIANYTWPLHGYTPPATNTDL